MDAREEILGRIRAAVAGTPEPPAVDRSYRDAPTPGGDLLAVFAERVEDYRATVVRCTTGEVAEVVRRLVAGRTSVVPPGLPWPVPGAVVDGATGRPLTAVELDRVEVVVTAAAVAVARTGTVVLDHGPDQGRRALTLVPDTHVCVVRADQVVPGVPEAVARLDPRRPQTWVSGPSATSDIELTRVEGVHGPRTLHVVLVTASAEQRDRTEESPQDQQRPGDGTPVQDA